MMVCSCNVWPFRNTETLWLGILRPLHCLLNLFLATQTRVTNIPLFLCFDLQIEALRSLKLNPNEITLTIIVLQYTSFFAFGGSNAISSIDLSNAYNGISGYNAAAVGLLTFCGNWAGPLLWTSAQPLIDREYHGRRKESLVRHLALLTTFTATNILFTMLACTALRRHLFIWTVFSPKYIYTIAWSIGQHLCVNVGYGSLAIWLLS